MIDSFPDLSLETAIKTHWVLSCFFRWTRSIQLQYIMCGDTHSQEFQFLSSKRLINPFLTRNKIPFEFSNALSYTSCLNLKFFKTSKMRENEFFSTKHALRKVKMKEGNGKNISHKKIYNKHSSCMTHVSHVLCKSHMIVNHTCMKNWQIYLSFGPKWIISDKLYSSSHFFYFFHVLSWKTTLGNVIANMSSYLKQDIMRT